MAVIVGSLECTNGHEVARQGRLRDVDPLGREQLTEFLLRTNGMCADERRDP